MRPAPVESALRPEEGPLHAAVCALAQALKGLGSFQNISDPSTRFGDVHLRLLSAAAVRESTGGA